MVAGNARPPLDGGTVLVTGASAGIGREQAGAVDVLVNNAGVGDQVLADQADWTRVRTVLRTNVLAVAQLTTALVPGMVNRGRGEY